MQNKHLSVTSVALPGESCVSRLYETMHLDDAYAVQLPKGAITDPELLARFLFSHQAPWVARLMQVRDALVARFGLKTSRQLQDSGDNRIYIFKIYETKPHEIILGEDDKHLDFRLSVLHQTKTVSAENTSYLIVSTVVHCHNRLGRAYIMLIAPFHRLVVKSGLRRAARAGWPLRPHGADSASS
jgi:hypothetical protein